ncbi:hypothetical protein P3342_009680 [Pyrenophora teres f. teres]|uniref:Uncharacterized protein n=1 Tax=Pyrenophora teres f. teres TaxID=97479 RepID=A0A6S6W936_9PLEO|nr:hypothetical protein HRS9139_08712 [Pyrenophora teres f. teres]KAE8834699.1 hypothetical protein PTNB85_06032 [Pyrenophora teres f. teres]KAE8843822.1 hypothetical protein HRS9122_04925 [Pyrenophora teres f. teres]KAE8859119.1 hypothetical protein PTNB73_08599 [Pyrenophora teres f. teres]KAE8860985.1 hypothetical protein PTNB29_06080 [Pyrenophora teres f. teres]
MEYLKKQRRAVEEYEKMLVDHVRSPDITTLSINVKENTIPCWDYCSRLHYLACGHDIHTEKPSMCGRNCINPIQNFAQFVCILCERQKMIKSGRISYRSSRPTELMLPDFPAFDQSHIPIMMRARDCNIAAIQWSLRKVVIPQTAKEIAILRLNDKRRLHGLLESLEKTARRLGCTPRLIGQIKENFMFCVDHQHLWVTVPYGQLATVVLYLTVMAKTGKPWLLNAMAIQFSASIEGLEDLLALVKNALIDFNGRKAIASFMPLFPTIRHEFRGKEEILTHLALKLWGTLLERDIFCFDFIEKFWRRIAVSCIYAVVRRNEILHFDEAIIKEKHIEKICTAISTGKYGQEGRVLDQRVAWQIAGDGAYHLLRVKVKERRQRKLRLRGARARDQGSNLGVDTLLASVVEQRPVASLYRVFANVEFNSWDTVLYGEGYEDVKRARKS